MSAARGSGPTPCHHATIHDLPDPVLAHIFSLLKRDALPLLLVSKAWLKVAEEHWGALWGDQLVDGDRVCLEGALAKRGFQSGFRKRAANMSVLRVRGCKDAFAAQLPTVLQTLSQCSSSTLRELDIKVAMRSRHYTACCEAAGQLTVLRRFRLRVLRETALGDFGSPLPLVPLLQLSSLSCLESLVLKVPYTINDGQVFSTLLPSLANLTQLVWGPRNFPPGELKLWWQRPDGSGPSLRHLCLSSCTLDTPVGAAGAGSLLLRALQHVERLELRFGRVAAAEQFAEVLPQLPGLTSLMLDGLEEPPEAEQRVLQAALLCPHLQELGLGIRSDWPSRRLPRDAAPGSLQQLTKLALRVYNEDVPPAWSLPRLKHLHIILHRAGDLHSLALHHSLEELVLSGHVPISEATQAISELVHLTRLAINCMSPEHTELHGGLYLASLKELDLQQTAGVDIHALPPALEQATSLERLDLSQDWFLALQKQDVQVLAKLPSLKAVRLPVPGPKRLWNVDQAYLEHNAVVVKCIQEELGHTGLTVEAAPMSHVYKRDSRWFI